MHKPFASDSMVKKNSFQQLIEPCKSEMIWEKREI